jgi:ABC-type sugar transport system ATPase subunit
VVGRDLFRLFTEARLSDAPVRLVVRGLSGRDVLNDVSLSVRGGEVVGLAGLVGARGTELARCLFEADGVNAGQIYLGWLTCRYSVAWPRGGSGDCVGA